MIQSSGAKQAAEDSLTSTLLLYGTADVVKTNAAVAAVMAGVALLTAARATRATTCGKARQQSRPMQTQVLHTSNGNVARAPTSMTPPLQLARCATHPRSHLEWQCQSTILFLQSTIRWESNNSLTLQNLWIWKRVQSVASACVSQRHTFACPVDTNAFVLGVLTK